MKSIDTIVPRNFAHFRENSCAQFRTIARNEIPIERKHGYTWAFLLKNNMVEILNNLQHDNIYQIKGFNVVNRACV